MRKQDLVDDIWVKIRMGNGKQTRLPATKSQTTKLVAAVFNTVAEALAHGESVSLPGFGKFQIKQYPKGSEVFSPWKKTKVPRRPDRLRTVKFRPFGALVRQLNQH